MKNSAAVVLSKSAVNQDRGFTGYRVDGESGLMYARARMYSAKLGRFVSRDPYRLLGELHPVFQDTYLVGSDLYAAYHVPNQTDSLGLYPDPKPESCSKKSYCAGTAYDPITECCKDFVILKLSGGCPCGQSSIDKGVASAPAVAGVIAEKAAAEGLMVAYHRCDSEACRAAYILAVKSLPKGGKFPWEDCK